MTANTIIFYPLSHNCFRGYIYDGEEFESDKELKDNEVTGDDEEIEKEEEAGCRCYTSYYLRLCLWLIDKNYIG